ncbi:CLUMA_CG019779, isoform A [Clunio marinus]|uniref:CLUMA_CG019779, isoform A n=1 Tax=Clunio marinus TaxID=568069 RepID=A0A1J1J331_9DIPT|nr:CLUMA_CG019779, isoform A [Clunio marinus]
MNQLGLIIAWLSAISSCLGIIVCVILLFWIMFLLECKMQVNMENINVDEIYKLQEQSEKKDLVNFCDVSVGISVVVILLGLALCVGLAYISYLCITGIKMRDHSKVKPYMIYSAICAVISFLNLLSSIVGLHTLIQGLFGTLFSIYFFIVIYSIYERFRFEREQGYAVQYNTPGATQVPFQNPPQNPPQYQPQNAGQSYGYIPGDQV